MGHFNGFGPDGIMGHFNGFLSKTCRCWKTCLTPILRQLRSVSASQVWSFVMFGYNEGAKRVSTQLRCLGTSLDPCFGFVLFALCTILQYYELLSHCLSINGLSPFQKKSLKWCRRSSLSILASTLANIHRFEQVFQSFKITQVYNILYQVVCFLFVYLEPKSQCTCCFLLK